MAWQCLIWRWSAAWLGLVSELRMTEFLSIGHVPPALLETLV